jgi:hypothetical protein
MLFTNKRTKVLGVLLASTLFLQSQCVVLAATGEATRSASTSLAQAALSASAASSDSMTSSIASALVPTDVPASVAANQEALAPSSSDAESSNAVSSSTPATLPDSASSSNMTSPSDTTSSSEPAQEIASIGAPGLEVAPPNSAGDLTSGGTTDTQPDDQSDSLDPASEKHNYFSINADPDSMKLAAADTFSSSTLRGGVTVEPTATLPQIDSLTRQILLKEIELERFNLHYKMEVAKQGRWKGIRYAGFQEVNATMGLAGGIIGVAERGSHLRSPKDVHTSLQENACIIPEIGAWVGAGAALLEFGINEWHDFKAMEHGFSPRAARAHVNVIKADIDKMLAERDALAKIEASAPTLKAHAEVDTVEGQILGDIRDQGLLEYSRYHIAARKLLAFQQMQYMFDFTKYATNALGFQFAFLSLHKHHRHWNFFAGVEFVVSGGITMGGPIVSRYFAKGMGELHKKYIRGTVQDAEAKEVAKLEQDEKTLDNLCKDGRCALDTVRAPIERATIYGAQSKVFQDELAASTKDRNKAKLTATQNIFGGLYVGASKVASGIMFIIPGYLHKYNVGSDSFASNRVTNADLFTASVIGLPASSYSMLDTLRIQVQGEVNRHKQMKAGTHPSQLVAARLAQLDDMEKRLNVNNK